MEVAGGLVHLVGELLDEVRELARGHRLGAPGAERDVGGRGATTAPPTIMAAVWTPANTRGARVQVNVVYSYAPIIPFLPDSIQLQSSSEVLISN